MTVRENRSKICSSQRAKRTMKSHYSEKLLFAAFDWTNDIFSPMRNDCTGKYAIFSSGANEQNIFELL